MSSLSEPDYQRLALSELSDLMAALDEHADDVDAELTGDVLEIELPDDSRIILNTQRPARQLWMAADRNAWHFSYRPEQNQWWDARANSELWGTLSSALSSKLGRSVSLSRPGV